MTVVRQEYACVVDPDDSLKVETDTDHRGVEFTILDEGNARGAVISWQSARRLRDQLSAALRARGAPALPDPVLSTANDGAVKLGG